MWGLPVTQGDLTCFRAGRRAFHLGQPGCSQSNYFHRRCRARSPTFNQSIPIACWRFTVQRDLSALAGYLTVCATLCTFVKEPASTIVILPAILATRTKGNLVIKAKGEQIL